MKLRSVSQLLAGSRDNLMGEEQDNSSTVYLILIKILLSSYY
jgi:hypothetical protein